MKKEPADYETLKKIDYKSLCHWPIIISGVLSRIYQMGMAFDKAGHIRRAKKDIDEVKSRFDVLHRTKSIDDELYEDVMKRADCIQDELDTLMETKKEILGTDWHWVIIDHRLAQIDTDYEPSARIGIDDWLLIIDYLWKSKYL